MLSLERTITGRVFLISTPMVGSRFATTTSPRFTPTTCFLLFKDAPGLFVAQFPIGQQVALLFSLPVRALAIVRRVIALQLFARDGVKKGRQHASDNTAAPRFRNDGVGSLHQVSGK